MKLEITEGADNIRVWSDSYKSQLILSEGNTSTTWPAYPITSMTYNLWVEGVEASDGPRDVELTLSYIRGSGEDDVIHEDKVRFTVVEVSMNVDGVTDNEETSKGG